jgi:hypothetical protein
MPRFIHLAPEPLAKRVRRNGIRARRVGDWFARRGLPDVDRLVWAFPVLPSFTLSHQWLRELKHEGARTLVAITFRLDDAEPVFASHYRDTPRAMTAAEAVGVILAQPEPLGYEVMVPRRIEPSEIVAVRHVPQNVGWRIMPERQKIWICSCPVCVTPGTVKSARRRVQFDRYVNRGGASR